MTTALAVAGVSIVAVIALFLGLQFWMIRKMQRQKGQPAPELDGKPGRVVGRGRPALFYFYSPQCGACRTMTPVVKKMEKERRSVFPVDVSRDMSMARKFGVMATPTTILVREGIVDQVLVGPQPEASLRSLV